jgi:hypothetical protein
MSSQRRFWCPRQDLNLFSGFATFVSAHFARKHRATLQIGKNSFLQTFTPACSFRVINCHQKGDVGVEPGSNFVTLHFTRQIGMPSHIARADLNPRTKFFCQELSGRLPHICHFGPLHDGAQESCCVIQRWRKKSAPNLPFPITRPNSLKAKNGMKAKNVNKHRASNSSLPSLMISRKPPATPFP